MANTTHSVVQSVHPQWRYTKTISGQFNLEQGSAGRRPRASYRHVVNNMGVVSGPPAWRGGAGPRGRHSSARGAAR